MSTRRTEGLRDGWKGGSLLVGLGLGWVGAAGALCGRDGKASKQASILFISIFIFIIIMALRGYLRVCKVASSR